MSKASGVLTGHLGTRSIDVILMRGAPLNVSCCLLSFFSLLHLRRRWGDHWRQSSVQETAEPHGHASDSPWPAPMVFIRGCISTKLGESSHSLLSVLHWWCLSILVGKEPPVFLHWKREGLRNVPGSCRILAFPSSPVGMVNQGGVI